MEINDFNGIGRITKDLQLNKTTNGYSALRFSIAIDRPKKQNETEKKTDYIPIVAFGDLADAIQKYCHKGSLIAVNGSIRTNTYEQNGQRKFSTEVLANGVKFLEPRQQQTTVQQSSTYEDSPTIYDDDLPF